MPQTFRSFVWPFFIRIADEQGWEHDKLSRTISAQFCISRDRLKRMKSAEQKKNEEEEGGNDNDEEDHSKNGKGKGVGKKSKKTD